MYLIGLKITGNILKFCIFFKGHIVIISYQFSLVDFFLHEFVYVSFKHIYPSN